jgi:hemerythrin
MERAMIEAHAWNERLDLGHEAMDHDHHLQVALVAALADSIEQGRPWLARKVAVQLREYSGVHFGSEELLMAARGYGAAEDHADEHRTLLVAMQEVEGALDRGEAELALAFAIELRAGLLSHIAGSDSRLAEHVHPARAVPRA